MQAQETEQRAHTLQFTAPRRARYTPYEERGRVMPAKNPWPPGPDIPLEARQAALARALEGKLAEVGQLPAGVARDALAELGAEHLDRLARRCSVHPDSAVALKMTSGFALAAAAQAVRDALAELTAHLS